MKRLKSIFKCLPVVLIALLATILYSCQDDSLLPNGDAGRPEEGLPATVSLKVCLPAMDVQTRALTDEEENYVGTIWVGVFKVCDKNDTDKSKDGMCAFNKIYNPPTETSSTYGVLYQVGKMLQTDLVIQGEELSGKARIVAVANAEHYKGIDPSKSQGGWVRKTDLDELLSGVETWEQFKNIKVMRNSTTDIQLTSNALLMSGYYDTVTYTEKDDGSKSANTPSGFVTADNIPTVDIYPIGSTEGTTTLDGAIYLRRLISYNKFNITHNPNINLSLKSWRVMNIPYCSYILEEDDNACTTVANGNNDGMESRVFNVVDGDSEARSIEFYQLENKHDAVPYDELDDGDYVGIKNSDDPYQSREREWKSTTDKTNTGAFKSLVAEDTPSAANNMASYVEITAELDYYYNAKYKDNPDKAEPEEAGASTDQIHRKAEVTYTIHLGYCEGDDGDNLAKAKDFNCRRNTKYTYNVLINGVNNIVVEAKSETDERQPGSEGTVKDMTAEPIVLDAHYGVFNIELTNSQRANLQWFITVPWANTVYEYDSHNTLLQQFSKESDAYTWIKFRPTSSSDVLAKYKDVNANPPLDDSNLLSLDDLAALNDEGKLAYPWAEGDDEPDGTTPHPYTVFIDEYVYHNSPDGTEHDEDGNETLWGNYVDKDDRQVDLYDGKMYPSSDKQSYYVPAIYSFSQRSIQTHYDDTAKGETAFGSEHINEVYGLNFNANNHGAYEDNRNGRYFGTKFVGQQWASWVDLTKPGLVPAASNTTWSGVSVPETTYPVPKLHVTNNSTSSLYLNPTTSDNYQAIASCMNRNRDLDGNGTIDINEYRWYVPTSEEYVQFSIGQSELPSPLFRFNEHSRTEFTDVSWPVDDDIDRRGQLQYHYMTSDFRYFFAEEGMSMGRGQFSMVSYQAQTICYQVRCIRQLGLNPDVAPANGSTFAYNSSFTMDTNSDGQIFISSTYFTENSIRSSVSTFLPPHDCSSTMSFPPAKFEVAKDVCRNITASDGKLSINAQGYISFTGNSSTDERNWYNSCNKNTLCSMYYQNSDKSDKGTWRVPNVRELSMMRTEGLISGTAEDKTNFGGDNNLGWYMSCTYDYFVNPKASASDFQYRFYGKRGDEDECVGRNCLTGYYWGSTNRIHLRCVRDVTTDEDLKVTDVSSANTKRSLVKRSLVKRSK